MKISKALETIARAAVAIIWALVVAAMCIAILCPYIVVAIALFFLIR